MPAMESYHIVDGVLTLLDKYYSESGPPTEYVLGHNVFGNSKFIFLADHSFLDSDFLIQDIIVYGEELHLCGDKIPKLYTTKAHLSDSIWNGTYNSCMWCNENFLVIGCGWNIATEAYDLGLSVFAINSNGSLTLKYQDPSLELVTALYHDGRFLYVGHYVSDSNLVRVYTIESDGTLTLKDTMSIGSSSEGYISGIKGDGRFIYVFTTAVPIC
jgi:hypothetical protein